ncbi:hypothetical protein C1646_771660 [Rhizophagus diaphanus]|nr:hypothetical protein C1646_771660 [Rhizophagus diaphanus] [Rhizophagus sp. MUCL 43196]
MEFWNVTNVPFHLFTLGTIPGLEYQSGTLECPELWKGTISGLEFQSGTLECPELWNGTVPELEFQSRTLEWNKPG